MSLLGRGHESVVRTRAKRVRCGVGCVSHDPLILTALASGLAHVGAYAGGANGGSASTSRSRYGASVSPYARVKCEVSLYTSTPPITGRQ